MKSPLERVLDELETTPLLLANAADCSASNLYLARRGVGPIPQNLLRFLSHRGYDIDSLQEEHSRWRRHVASSVTKEASR